MAKIAGSIPAEPTNSIDTILIAIQYVRNPQSPFALVPHAIEGHRMDISSVGDVGACTRAEVNSLNFDDSQMGD
tara:strand:- start:25 stop:246 length:222 start_codon:yes stop_codon:yes gene_type:complete